MSDLQVEGGDMCTQLGYETEIRRGIPSAEDHPDGNDDEVFKDVREGGGCFGIIVNPMEGRVDVVLIQQYFAVRMCDPKIPNVRPVTLQGGPVMNGWVFE